MARDLHDVVAHNIAVINVQANTALHLMDRQPERARTALATINDVSKQALVELRPVLGVLRDVDSGGVTGAPRAPAPGLARLSDLVDNAAAAGLAVRVEEDGQAAPLPADVDLTAYRIIQEALTNSARHSGGSTATVRLGYGDGYVDRGHGRNDVLRFGWPERPRSRPQAGDSQRLENAPGRQRAGRTAGTGHYRSRPSDGHLPERGRVAVRGGPAWPGREGVPALRRKSRGACRSRRLGCATRLTFALVKLGTAALGSGG